MRRHSLADLESLRPRSKLIPLAYAATVAATLALVVWIAADFRSRQGQPGTPAAVAGVAAPSHAEQPIIAVLPLTNLSSEPDSDYLVDGLTDEIIRNLASVRGLQVRSRTSSFAFKNKPRNLREVGQLLGANLVVEGSVLRSGNQLRINAQLVQVAGDVPLWSDRFTRELKDVFLIQDEISRAIVNKLRLTLGQGQRRYDLDPETYEIYLKARVLAERRDRAGPQKAVEMFEQVITRDPAFAPAYAGLVNAYAWMSMLPYQGASFQTAQSIMRPAALKAVDLDPMLAEAHAAMGWVRSREFDWEKAEQSFRRAIDLNPSLTQVYSGFSFSTLRPLGRFDEAEQLMQAAREIDPLSLDVLREIGQLQFLAGRHVDAITTLQHVYAADPDLPFVKVFLGRSLSFAGRVTEAIPLLGDPRNNHYAAHAYVRAGRRVDVEKVAVTHAGYPQRLAVIYAALEDKDRTLAMLERMIADEPHRVAVNLSFPEFAFLQGDPRLAALRKTLNLPRDPAAFNPSERPIIAVLPFKNLSSEAGSDYFVDGLTDELIRNLAVIEGLAVRSQTSSFFFKDKPRNLREVGKQLGANLVVEGSVLRSGNRLRINAQLVPIAQDVPLWSGRFNRELKDIFAIQDEISLAIVNKLRLTLGRGQRRYELDPEAYALYLKGRALVDRKGVPSAEEAAGLFEAAVARDPAFAPAHAGLALAYATDVGADREHSPVCHGACSSSASRGQGPRARSLVGGCACSHGVGARARAQLDRSGARLPARHRTQSEPDSKLHRLFVVDACTARQGRGSVGSSPIRAAKRSVVTRCSAHDRERPVVRRAFRRGDRDSAARSRGRSRPSVRGRMAGARADVCRQARRGGAATGKKRRPPSRSLQARAVWTRAAPRVLICRDRQTRGRRSAAGRP